MSALEQRAPEGGRLRVMNIHQATDLYLAEAARQGKSPRTRDRYRRHFEKLGDMYPHYDVDEVTTVMIRRYLDRWQDNAPATSAQIISMLRAFFGWLTREGIIPTDPTERLERPKLQRPEEQDHLTSLSTDEVRRMLGACETWTERLALYVLAYTGSRRGAVAQLRRRDYDKDAGASSAEDTHPTQEVRPAAHRDHTRGAHPRARNISTLRTVDDGGQSLAAGRPHLQGAVLAATQRLLVRVAVEPARGRLRVARALPVPAGDVRPHTVRPPIRLRPAGERVGCGLAGAA